MTDQPKVSAEALLLAIDEFEHEAGASTRIVERAIKLTAIQPAAAGTRMAVDDRYTREFLLKLANDLDRIPACSQDQTIIDAALALQYFAAAHSGEPTDAQRASYDPLVKPHQDEPK